MPRKKPDASTRTTKPTPTVPMIARYLCLAIAELQTLVMEGRETAATKLQLEIEDQLSFRFSGESLMTFRTLVGWIRERAQDLAVQQGVGFVGVVSDADFTEAGGVTIEHD